MAQRKKTATKKKTAKKKAAGRHITRGHQRTDAASISREKFLDPALLTEKETDEVRRRGIVNRIVRQEDMRDRIAAGQHLRRLAEIDESLVGIVKRTMESKLLSKDENKKIKLRLKALKLRTDQHLKLLNKLLGDEKTLELRDPQGNNPFHELANVMKMALTDDGDLDFDAGTEGED